jgi:hypothetical protein
MEEVRVPRLTRLLWGITVLEGIVLAGAGVLPFVFPGFSVLHAPWQTGPFNMRFVGAVYLASLVAVLSLLLNFRWAVARLALRMLVVFTTLVLLVSVVAAGQFYWHRPLTWAWFVLYLILPVNAAWHAWKYRGFPRAETTINTKSWRGVFTLQGAFGVVYGVALLVAPVSSSAFWPWAVDALHARLYSAIFLTLGVAAIVVRERASSLERSLLGWTQVVLGLSVPLGLVWTDLELRRVDWGTSGVWVWLSLFGMYLIVGVGLLIALRREPATSSFVMRHSGFGLTRGYFRWLGAALLAQGVLAGLLNAINLEPSSWTLGLLEFHFWHSAIHVVSGLGLIALAGVRGVRTEPFVIGSAFGVFYVAFAASSLHTHEPLGIPTSAVVNALHFLVGLPAVALGVWSALNASRHRLEWQEGKS